MGGEIKYKLVITLPCTVRELAEKLKGFDRDDVLVCRYDGNGDSLYASLTEPLCQSQKEEAARTLRDCTKRIVVDPVRIPPSVQAFCSGDYRFSAKDHSKFRDDLEPISSQVARYALEGLMLSDGKDGLPRDEDIPSCIEPLKDGDPIPEGVDGRLFAPIEVEDPFSVGRTTLGFTRVCRVKDFFEKWRKGASEARKNGENCVVADALTNEELKFIAASNRQTVRVVVDPDDDNIVMELLNDPQNKGFTKEIVIELCRNANIALMRFIAWKQNTENAESEKEG